MSNPRRFRFRNLNPGTGRIRLYISLWMNGKVERRTHPTYDKTHLRRVLTGFATGGLSVLPAALTRMDWFVYPCLLGMLASFGYIVWVPVNRTSCPTCGRLLYRPPDTTEFTCQVCNVLWVTRSWGSDFRD